MRYRRVLAVLLTMLTLASLSCQAFTDFLTLEGPEDQATDGPFTFPTPATPATAGPPPATLPPPATPEAAFDLTLDEADDAQAALRPEFAADLALPSLAGATRYVLDVTVTFESERAATLTGHAGIRYTNQTDAALEDVVLMLWPNHPTQYFGDMALGTVTVAGTAVEPAFENDDLAARLPLAAPLAPGEHVDLSADFTVHATSGVEDGARFGLTHGVLLAPSFYPMVPRLIDGQWETEPAPTGGDTTNSDTSFYAWRVTAPAGLALAATGSVVDSTDTPTGQTQVLVTGPVRDLALVVGPLELSQRTVDGITVNAYLLAEHAGEAQPMLDQAETQILNLEDKVGPYPFAELDIIDAPGAFGGIEYPALIFVGVVGDGDFEVANVHEVGHQWFYSLIGDDQLREPWLDEAAASYTEVLYYEQAGGAQAARSHLDYFWLYVAASDNPELPIGLAIKDYPDGNDYGLLVYGKGALFFDALRQRLGDEVFFQFLHNYYDTYKYGFATGAGFQAVAEQTCACELDDLFNLWVFEGGRVQQP
jgi:hypothetical protein